MTEFDKTGPLLTLREFLTRRTGFMVVFSGNPGGNTWTDMPAALTEFLGTTRTRPSRVDLTGCTQARLTGRVITAGAATAELRVQYSLDNSTWDYLDATSGPSMAIATANSSPAGSWVTIVAAARTDVYLRLLGINGDGALDPNFGLIQMQVR